MWKLCGSYSVLGTEPGPACILLFYVPKLFVSVTLKSKGATDNATVSTSGPVTQQWISGIEFSLSGNTEFFENASFFVEDGMF